MAVQVGAAHAHSEIASVTPVTPAAPLHAHPPDAAAAAKAGWNWKMRSACAADVVKEATSKGSAASRVAWRPVASGRSSRHAWSVNSATYAVQEDEVLALAEVQGEPSMTTPVTGARPVALATPTMTSPSATPGTPPCPLTLRPLVRPALSPVTPGTPACAFAQATSQDEAGMVTLVSPPVTPGTPPRAGAHALLPWRHWPASASFDCTSARLIPAATLTVMSSGTNEMISA